MKIKDKIFDYVLSKQPERSARFPHLDQPLKIMLIYESDYLERNDAIKSIRQELLKRQMDITMWGYVEKKEITTLILPQSRILGPNDYNLLGKPREEVIKDLQEEHYDLLIDLTTRPLLPLRYLALFTDADFKVGLHLGEGVHDMLISLTAESAPTVNDSEQGDNETVHQVDPVYLYNQIIEYLTTIKSND